MRTNDYKITLQDNVIRDAALRYLLRELKHWGVSSDRYQVEGQVITTRDANVVDVATESFIKRPDLMTVERVKL